VVEHQLHFVVDFAIAGEPGAPGSAPRCSALTWVPLSILPGWWPPSARGGSAVVPRSSDMQGRGVVLATVRLYNNLDILIQRHEEAQKTFDGKLTEFPAQHFRYIGLANAEQLGGFLLFQSALFHERVNLEYQLRFDEVLFRIRYADVFKDIPVPGLARPGHRGNIVI